MVEDGDRKRVVVVGAGIIGIAAAFRLAEAGFSVQLLEKDEPANAASRGNAGAFAFPSIMPLASPGILLKAPKWLLDPLGPLAIPPREFPVMVPWLLRFCAASLPARVRRSTGALASLNELSRSETADLVSVAGLSERIRSDGALELYEGEAAWKATLPEWEHCESLGIAVEHVRGSRLAELQPGLAPRFTHAVFLPQWQTVSDPRKFALGLMDAARTRGVELLKGAVMHIEESTSGCMVVMAGGNTIKCAQVVVAAGPWSAGLARQLGNRIPLIAERGYNTTLPASAFDLKRQLIFPAHGFVVTPLETGIRVGGASELARFSAPVNFKRAKHMLDKAAAFMPELKKEGGVEWMGSRPSLPDSLPVIGRATSQGRVIYAFGHGHLGLTQSAATARLVLQMVQDKPLSIDLDPFRPERF